MKLLLDTHTFLFAIGEPKQLSTGARRALLETSNQRFVSVVSFWEIAIKTQSGKLDLPTDVEFYQEHLRRLSAVVLPVEARHTFELLRLPTIHKDPFDRLLVAQARVDGLTVLSRDESVAQYDVRVLW